MSQAEILAKVLSDLIIAFDCINKLVKGITKIYADYNADADK